jgi:SAM-dependent methyltransferase
MDHHKLFSDKADLYKSSRPVYPAEIFNYLASLCSSTHLAWDSACGNGQAAVGLIEKFDKVYATDVSEEQIANAKPHPRISYEVSPSEKTRLENASCDLVCVAQALHWFNYELFWPEVQRVLKPGGVFTAFGYNWPSVNKEIDAAIKASVFDVVEPYWAANNKLLWNHYRDLVIPFEKLESPKFTMETRWNLDEFFNFIHTFSATRRCMDVMGDEFFQKGYAAVGKLWGDANQKKPVDLDFVFYAGRKD